MKRIDLLMNDDDLEKLLDYFSELNLFCYSEKSFRAINLNIINVKISYQDKIENAQTYIDFCPSHGNIFPYSDSIENISEAYIVIDGENEEDVVLVKAFNKIKKYVKNHFILSQNKLCYIGPGMYQDWLARKIKIPFLLMYDEVIINEEDLELKSFFNDITNDGYIVKVDRAELSKADVLDLNAEDFAIYTPSSKIGITKINTKINIPDIERRVIVRYDNDSEAIFMYKHKKNKKRVFVFLLDERITCTDCPKLHYLFQKLKGISM